MILHLLIKFKTKIKCYTNVSNDLFSWYYIYIMHHTCISTMPFFFIQKTDLLTLFLNTGFEPLNLGCGSHIGLSSFVWTLWFDGWSSIIHWGFRSVQRNKQNCVGRMRMLGYICMRNRKRRSCEHVTFLVSLWTISQTILLCVSSPSSHYVCELLLPTNVNLSWWFQCGKFVITVYLYGKKSPFQFHLLYESESVS